MKRILDLHTYILPAMADGKGPQSMAESVQMVKDLVRSWYYRYFLYTLRLMS